MSSDTVVLRPPTPEEIAQARLPARYEAACQAIAECESLEELKEMGNRQAALASYARLAQDTTLHNRALRVQQRAQRRMGELLKQMPNAQGANLTAAGRAGAVPICRTRAAAEAGISERQRKTAQRIASIPAADFEARVKCDNPATITEMARLGTLSRIPDPPPEVPPADPATVARAHRGLREFAAFCGVTDPVAVAHGGGDTDMLRGQVETIRAWLDRFVVNLPVSAADSEVA